MSNGGLFLVDAFADEPFRGNPAAVVLLETERPDEWLQALATELSQPATAFVRSDGERFDLRWFTPTVELQLCGHGTDRKSVV